MQINLWYDNKMIFGDVLEIKNGKNQKAVENPKGAYPIYGSGGIMGYADDYICKADTVVVGRKGSINNPIYVEEPFWNVDTAFGLEARQDVLKPRYLYYFCKKFDFERLNKAVTIPSLTKSDLLKIKINLPDIDQQQVVIDKLMKIEKIIEYRKDELSASDDLIKARFVEMFGSIHESTEYPYVTVKDLTDTISGGTPSREHVEYWENGTIPWVKTTELHNNVISNTEEYITEAGLNGSSAKLVPRGTVLVAMYGQGKTRGMTAYLNIEACTNQACACILPSDKIDSMYMWKFFELSYDKLRSLAQGAGQPNLNGNMIKNFQVLVPPIMLQREYIDFVRHVDKSKVAIQKSLDETKLLFDSLMQEYFG